MTDMELGSTVRLKANTSRAYSALPGAEGIVGLPLGDPLYKNLEDSKEYIKILWKESKFKRGQSNGVYPKEDFEVVIDPPEDQEEVPRVETTIFKRIRLLEERIASLEAVIGVRT